MAVWEREICSGYLRDTNDSRTEVRTPLIIFPFYFRCVAKKDAAQKAPAPHPTRPLTPVSIAHGDRKYPLTAGSGQPTESTGEKCPLKLDDFEAFPLGPSSQNCFLTFSSRKIKSEKYRNKRKRLKERANDAECRFPIHAGTIKCHSHMSRISHVRVLATNRKIF